MYPLPSPPHLFHRPPLGNHEASVPIPSPKLDASSPFFPFSPAIFDHEILNDLVLLAPPPQIPPPSPPPPPPSRPNDTPTHENTVAAAPTKAFCRVKKNTVRKYTRVLRAERRRPLRKDRHSKIFTAQGPRDRRMRLSVDVARKFFDLQDMLGFDKASKTVDWLLTNSQSSIKELAGCFSPPAHHGASDGSNAKRESSICEFEVIPLSTNHNSPLAAKGMAAVRSMRASTHLTPSRESRLMARARARERTMEKRMQERGFEEGGKKEKPAPSSSPFEATEEESTEQNVKTSSELVVEDGKPISSCSPDQQKKNSGDPTPAMTAAVSSPISIFDYNQNNNHTCDAFSVVHQEHWSVQPLGNIEDQRAFLADGQVQSWLWETFNACI